MEDPEHLLLANPVVGERVHGLIHPRVARRIEVSRRHLVGEGVLVLEERAHLCVEMHPDLAKALGLLLLGLCDVLPERHPVPGDLVETLCGPPLEIVPEGLGDCRLELLCLPVRGWAPRALLHRVAHDVWGVLGERLLGFLLLLGSWSARLALRGHGGRGARARATWARLIWRRSPLPESALALQAA